MEQIEKSNSRSLFIGNSLAYFLVLLWAVFILTSTFLEKEVRFGILLCYSLIWLITLWKKPQNVMLKNIVVVWVLTRILCFFSEPFYENDYYRYIWDGIVGSHLQNPLVLSPAEISNGLPSFGLDLEERLNRQDAIDQRSEILPESELQELITAINFPESPSIYGPFAQVFLGLQSLPLKFYRSIFPDDVIPIVWRIHVLRSSFLLIDLLCCVVLYVLLNKLSKPKSWLLIYLLSPVLLKEVGNSLHIDLLSTLCLTLSYLCLIKKNNFLSGICLALATGVKMYAVVLLPFYVLWTKSKKLFVAYVLCMAVLYFPFVISGGQEIWVGTKYFSQLWSMNDFFPAVIREVLYRNLEENIFTVEAYPIGVYEVNQVQWLARVVSLSCFACLCLYFLLKTFKARMTEESMGGTVCYLIFAVFWFSPVQNPWYYLWGLPLYILFNRKLILFFVGCSQLYLFNFYMNPTSHLLEPFQWWVIGPNVAAIVLWTIFKLRKDVSDIQPQTV